MDLETAMGPLVDSYSGFSFLLSVFGYLLLGRRSQEVGPPNCNCIEECAAHSRRRECVLLSVHFK